MEKASTKRFLFLVDDGWRHEKREILRYLRGRIRFEVITHDPMTVEALRHDMPVRLIPRVPLKRNLLTFAVMFFARELQTSLVQYRRRIQRLDAPPLHRFGLALRHAAHRLGLHFYSFTQALAWLYRTSNHYADALRGFDALVYMPVAVIDKRVIFEAKHAGLKIVNWIYSWDNPMKDNEFLSDADRYFVWNEPNRQDLRRYHGVPAEKIDIVGPVQFDYLFETDYAAIPPAPEPYVLYACAVGLDFHLAQEVEIILNIRKILDELRPGMKLCVRPYPFRKSIDGYTRLRGVPGIELLDFGKVEQGRILITDEVIRERIVQIRQAACFINFGSTIGLEAAFTGTPILQLNFNYPNPGPRHKDLSVVLRNEHLRYIILPDYPNIVGSPEALKRRLGQVLDGDTEPFLAYSETLKEFCSPLGSTCYKEALARALAGI